jgi:hypothetical protein
MLALKPRDIGPAVSSALQVFSNRKEDDINATALSRVWLQSQLCNGWAFPTLGMP